MVLGSLNGYTTPSRVLANSPSWLNCHFNSPCVLTAVLGYREGALDGVGAEHKQMGDRQAGSWLDQALFLSNLLKQGLFF